MNPSESGQCSAQNGWSALDGLGACIAFLEKHQRYYDLRNKIGSVSISVAPCHFLARSNSTRSCIYLDSSLFQKKTGDIFPLAIESILFEMCNLEQTDQVKNLEGRANELTPDEFVQKYEQIEYQSALKTREILRKCLPVQEWNQYPMANMHTAFRPHYLMQQTINHSYKIWERYAHLFDKKLSYKGAWEPVPEDEKLYVVALITRRSGKDHLDPIISSQAQEDYQILKNHILIGNAMGYDLCARLARRLPMIESVFDENAAFL